MEDIYGDLDNFDMGDTIKELQKENAKLTEHIQALTNNLDKTMKELENVKKANEILQQNISKLFNTAKADFDRKSRMIDELRRKYDDIVFKRNQGQNYKIPKRKPEIQLVNEQPEIKRRKMTDADVKINEKQYNDRKNSTLKDIYKSDDNRRGKLNKLRDSKRRRSLSRSRERRRKSPVRESFRSNRDYDRNKSKPYSPDIRPKINEPTSYESEHKQVLNLILTNKAVRSDSDSVVSIHSGSSLEDYIAKTEDKPKKKEEKNKEKIRTKYKKSDKNCDKDRNKDIKVDNSTNKKENKTLKVKSTEEVEEGEISDDDCDVSKETSENKKAKREGNKKDKKIEKSSSNKNCTNITEKEKNSDIKYITNDDWPSVSINEEASISVLIEQSEKLKKHLYDIDSNDKKLNEDKSENTCSNNNMVNNISVDCDTDVKCDADFKCDTLVNTLEAVLDTSVIRSNIDTVKSTNDVKEENVSNNRTPESVEKKKPKRRRCVLLVD